MNQMKLISRSVISRVKGMMLRVVFKCHKCILLQVMKQIDVDDANNQSKNTSYIVNLNFYLLFISNVVVVVVS